MSQSVINVEPLDIIRKIEKVELAEIKVIPFTSAIIKVMLRDINDVYIDNRNLEMTTPDYLAWLNDDTYLVNWVLTQLNLTKKTIN